jgi:hypothetical protein
MTLYNGKRKPVAPAVYRPQKSPAVLQRMIAAGHPLPPSHMARQPVGPPAYRPQPVPKVLQRKESPVTKSPAVPNNRASIIPPRHQGLRPQTSVQLMGISPNRGVVQRQIWIKSHHDEHRPYEVREAYGLVSQFFTYQREETSERVIGRRVTTALNAFSRLEKRFETVVELWDAIMQRLAYTGPRPVTIQIHPQVRLRGLVHPARVTLGPPMAISVEDMYRIDPEGHGNTDRPRGSRAPQYQLKISKENSRFYLRCDVAISARVGTVKSVYAAPGKRRWILPGRFPGKNIVITREHSRSCKHAEQQHCDDVAYVYLITLDAAEKVLSDMEMGPFDTKEEAASFRQHFDASFEECLNQYLLHHFGINGRAQYVGTTPEAWLNCFRVTCEQTGLRDNYGWHSSDHDDRIGEVGPDNYIDIIAIDGPHVPEGRNVKPEDLIILGTTFEQRRRN